MEKLTFTRFVAAFAVVLTHFGRDIPFIDDLPWSHFLRQGSFMVSYFFVLSGFIMAAVYWDLDSRADRRAYWIARLARIYPVYLFALVFMMLLDTENGPRPLISFALNASLLQAWFPTYVMTGNPPGWSLSTEAFFYLVFPFCVPLLRAMPGLWRPLAAIIAVWLASQVGYHAGRQFLEVHHVEVVHNALHYVPLLHLNSFLAGIAANLVLRRGSWRNSRDAGQSSQAGTAFALIVTSFALILAALWVLGRGLYVAGAFVSAANGLLAPLFALFIGALAVDRSRWTRWLAWAPLVALGEMSYAVYILQDPVREVVYRLGTGPWPMTDVPLFYTYLATLVALSAVVWRWYEQPMRRYLRVRLGAPGRARAARAAVV
ncbi:MAG: acyltransferase [Casimicrobiaceae bacterium]